MEELRPRIKPHAPASLKQNVLEAVSHSPAHRGSPPFREGLGIGFRLLRLAVAAAVLLLGIMTFALIPRTSTEKRTNTDFVAKADMRTSTDVVVRVDREAPTDMVVQNRGEEKGSTTAPQATIHKNTAIYNNKVLSDAPPAEELMAANTEKTVGGDLKSPTPKMRRSNPHQPVTLPKEIANGEANQAPLPSGGDRGGLQGGESTLLANLEAHRDLVNACLADELAQARHAWQRVSQVRLQYQQDYEELQQRISEQIQDDINAIGHRDDDTPKEV